MLKKKIIAEIILLKERPLLMLYLLFPALLAILLKVLYPLITNQLESLFRLAPENWLTLVLITVISSIPIITGVVLSSLNSGMEMLSLGKKDIIKSLLGSSAISFFVTFSLIVLSTLITNPVPGEGWLRILYVSILFSLLSVYIMLVLNRCINKVKHLNIYILCCFFLFCVPFGLLTSTPWHYIAFISPLYWINWAWIFPDKSESILSGIFAFTLIGGAISPLILVLCGKKFNE